QETRIKIAQDSIDNFYWHLLLHVPALHSLVPAAILPNSGYAFIGQAWSISLEWQFYLIAPFAIAFFKKPKSVLWAIAMVSLALVLMLYGREASKGFIGAHMHFFLIGALSFYALRLLRDKMEWFRQE